MDFFVARNDVWEYVSLVTGNSKPTQQDLERVMGWYQRARNGQNLEQIQEEVANSRQ